ncbi:hypothetical protein [Aeribacillus pallidus]|uniref:hypothetical protein n=1 Tax=Aeribacillus pallidus TaxID=33936 RepID=UPI003D2318D4
MQPSEGLIRQLQEENRKLKEKVKSLELEIEELNQAMFLVEQKHRKEKEILQRELNKWKCYGR